MVSLGVYSARYAGENATDKDRINKVLDLMKDVIDDEKRTARFKCVICYINKDGEIYTFEGTCEGIIAKEPQGFNDFGYDPIFMYEGTSFANMTSEEKNKVSHRANALKKFVEFLENQN